MKISLLNFLFFFSFFLICIYFWDTERQSANRGGAEREGDTESEAGSRLQAPSCQHRVWCGAQARTHEAWDHDLGRSRTLHRLSHSDAPISLIFSKSSLRIHLAGCFESFRWRLRCFLVSPTMSALKGRQQGTPVAWLVMHVFIYGRRNRKERDVKK